MSGSTYKHTAPIEDLLKGLSDAAAVRREQDEARQRASAIDGHSIFAAAVALFIFIPGCAAATVFLLQTDDAIASPARPVVRKPLLVKADRLPLSEQPPDGAYGFEAATVARPGPIEAETALHMQSDAGFLGAVIIRGRIEDELSEAAVDAANAPDAGASAQTVGAAPPQSFSPPPKQKLKHHAVRPRAPRLIAETVSPEPEPPSLLQRLFGLRSL
jgi:hypothetical protein